MPRACYEDMGASGESICGYHREPLIEKRIPSPTQSQPMIVLFCPVSGRELKYIP